MDGQRFNIGDTEIPFCIQSCSKALNYAISIADLGPKKVHQHLGKEPSGIGFKQIQVVELFLFTFTVATSQQLTRQYTQFHFISGKSLYI